MPNICGFSVCYLLKSPFSPLDFSGGCHVFGKLTDGVFVCVSVSVSDWYSRLDSHDILIRKLETFVSIVGHS